MLIPKKKVIELSRDVGAIIDGHELDLRDNTEGAWSELRNQIHTLASLKNEQVKILERERKFMQEILADISHQLKTPLTSMMITADLLETASEEMRVEFLNRMRTDLTHTEWLVSALLKQAKLDAGVVPFRMEKHAVCELIRAAIAPVEILIEMRQQTVQIRSNGMHLEDLSDTNSAQPSSTGMHPECDPLDIQVLNNVKHDPDYGCDTHTLTDVYLTCDVQWTTEALTNIIKNASEHSPNQGNIVITYGANPICTWISIEDSGDGIVLDAIPNLFRRFKGSRSEKGYGIGLPMALSIVRNQNGDIEVDGAGDGKGAIFIVKFYNVI